MKNKLKKSAFEVFAIKGYHASLSEIAKKTGIKKPSIYNHFKNKEALFYTIIEEEIYQFFTLQADAFKLTEGAPDKERLKNLFYNVLTYYTDHQKLRFWRQMLLIDSEELMVPTRELIRQNEKNLYTQVLEVINRILEDDQDDREKNMPLLYTMVALIQGTLDGMLLYHNLFEPDLLFDNVWQVYWSSIEAEVIKKE